MFALECAFELDVRAVGPSCLVGVPDEGWVLLDEVGGFLCFLGESFFDAAECACGVAATVWEYPLIDDDDAVLFDVLCCPAEVVDELCASVES